MPRGDWRAEYGALLDAAAAELADVSGLDLTVECITHRFTPVSKDVLEDWYPRTQLEMDPEVRSRKRGKFGSVKYVYPVATMVSCDPGSPLRWSSGSPRPGRCTGPDRDNLQGDDLELGAGPAPLARCLRTASGGGARHGGP